MTQRIGAEDGHDDREAHSNRIHNQAWTRCETEDDFAEKHRERDASGGSDEAAAQAEQNCFREKKAKNAAPCSTDGFHEADVVAALHGDIGHGGHDAERGENEHDGDGEIEQAGDARVDFGLRFSELADRADVEIGEFLLERRNIAGDLRRSSRNVQLNDTNPVSQPGEFLDTLKWKKNLRVLGAAKAL